ncbi:MAG: phenylalanine 4-monooxygenase [Gemmatimonadota bacterium]
MHAPSVSQPNSALSAAAAFLTTQPESYRDEQDAVWAALYRRRVATLRTTACRELLRGMDAIGLSPDRVPLLSDVNARLARLTGWSAVAVTGFLPADMFFALLAERRFPVTVNVRRMEELEYTPAPDIFHDVFGHLPLHSHPVFAQFLQRFGEVASRAVNDTQREAMRRLFWFTVEFGLVREDGEPKIYGSGLVSSAGDGANALGPACARHPFSLQRVIDQAFEIDHLQNTLFVLDTFDDLFGVPEQAAALVGIALDGGRRVA